MDGDPSNDPVEGFAKLLFRDLDPQNGEGRLDDDGNPILTSVVDTGDFDISDVVTIEIAFGGPNPSGAVDNLVFSTTFVDRLRRIHIDANSTGESENVRLKSL